MARPPLSTTITRSASPAASTEATQASSIAEGAENVTMTTTTTRPSDHTGSPPGDGRRQSGDRFTSVLRMTGTMFITGDADADQLLNTDGTAVLIGMLLDQQVPMEWAFTGPATLHARLGHLDASKIAAMDQEEFVAVCCAKPAIHRFPASMGRRIHDMCVVLVEQFDGHGEGVWAGVTSGDELYDRLRTLPGYGDEKARIFVAILGKRFGVRPKGWQEAAGKFGDDSPRSVADITDPTSLGKVREWKKAAKAAKKDKQDRPVG